MKFTCLEQLKAYELSLYFSPCQECAENPVLHVSMTFAFGKHHDIRHPNLNKNMHLYFKHSYWHHIYINIIFALAGEWYFNCTVVINWRRNQRISLGWLMHSRVCINFICAFCFSMTTWSLELLLHWLYRLLTEDPNQRLGARGASEVYLSCYVSNCYVLIFYKHILRIFIIVTYSNLINRWSSIRFSETLIGIH